MADHRPAGRGDHKLVPQGPWRDAGLRNLQMEADVMGFIQALVDVLGQWPTAFLLAALAWAAVAVIKCD